MKKRILVRALVTLLSTTIVSGALSMSTSATQSVSFNGILDSRETETDYMSGMQMPVALCAEDGDLNKDVAKVLETVSTLETEDMAAQKEEYPLASEWNLFELDWEKASDEEINHYLGMTEWNIIGMWLSSMEEEELHTLLERNTVLMQETTIQEPDAEPIQMIYYEYALQKYTSTLMTRAAYPSKTSGYWTTKIVQTNAVGTPVRTAVITCKVSGIDTSVPTTQRQSVTVAKSVTGNWCNISWNNEKESLGSFRTDTDSSTYPHVRANFQFFKPAGYKVITSYSLVSSLHKIYWSKSKTFQANSMFLDGGTLSSERYVYPEAATCNNISTASLVESKYAGTHYLCSVVNMYVNAGIGTTSNATKGNLVQTITLQPITYNVNYNGNGSTSGAVSAQSCSYDVNYTTQANGFQREYTVTYDGNGGIPSVNSQKASYVFKGWGRDQTSSVTHAAGATYKNMTAVSGGVATMYALWNPVSVKLPTAVREGYTFSGWNIGSAGATYIPTTNVTAIAKWTPNAYKIIFQTGGGSECADMSATYDKSVVLPTPERVGYTFAGWKGTTGTYVGSVKNLATESGEEVVLVAEWIPETDIPYTVRCYKQPSLNVKNKGDYVMFGMKNGDAIDGEYSQYGTTDTTVSVTAPGIEGYITPSAQNVKIAGDGSSVVNFYYDLKTVPEVNASFSASDAQIDEIAKRIAAGLSFSLEVDGVEYEIAQKSDGTLGIRFISTDAAKIVIPDVVKIADKVYRITEIHADAFKGNVTVREVELSANIAKIGDSAFEGCTSLEKIVLREGLVDIGNKAFLGCSSLKNVMLPNSVQTIGSFAFRDCKALSKVELNEGLLKIGKKAFYNCSALRKLTVPKTVLEMDAYAFAKCSGLSKISFTAGSKLLSVGTGIFSECSALKKIKLPSKLTNIAAKAFYHCKKLKSVTGGASVTKIGAKAFTGCSKLTKITISSKVQSVGKNAFYKCKSLKKVTVKSKSLTTVGAKAFKQCKKGIVFVVPKAKKSEYSKLLRGKY